MDNNSQDCVGGCGGVKTLQHLFFFFYRRFLENLEYYFKLVRIFLCFIK